MVTLMKRVSWVWGCVLLPLVACQERVGLAPVFEARSPRESMPSNYRVQREDTLYSIAFRYDQDYHLIARMNGLYPPYALHAGQVIQLRPAPVLQYRPPPTIYPVKIPTPKPVVVTSRLRWPTDQKRVLNYFSPEKGRKGIDISGKAGHPIYASNPGVVAYAGDGLNGYGNLIIIKHNDKLLTAYAHCARNLVKEGQRVQTGQKIATMGLLDRQHYGVHYEVRQWGKPVNPFNYLR